MIELFKCGLSSLEDLKIVRYAALLHCGRTNFLTEWGRESLRGDVENYVLKGRDNLELRYPMLTPRGSSPEVFGILAGAASSMREKRPRFLFGGGGDPNADRSECNGLSAVKAHGTSSYS